MHSLKCCSLQGQKRQVSREGLSLPAGHRDTLKTAAGSPPRVFHHPGAEIFPLPGEGNNLRDIPGHFLLPGGSRNEGDASSAPGAQPAGKGVTSRDTNSRSYPASYPNSAKNTCLPPRERWREASREGKEREEGKGREGKGEREREETFCPPPRAGTAQERPWIAACIPKSTTRSCWQSRGSSFPQSRAFGSRTGQVGARASLWSPGKQDNSFHES